MPGPIINMPGALVPIFDYTMQAGAISDLHLKQDWAQYFHNLGNVAIGATRSGSTSVRPTSTMPRWIGMPYFDQTLNQEIFLQSVNPDVWFDPVSTAVATATSAALAAVKNDRSVAKAWAVFDGTNASPITPQAAYGISGTIIKNSAGVYTLSFSTNFSSVNYGQWGCCNNQAFVSLESTANKTTSTCRIQITNTAGVSADQTYVFAGFFGDQ